MRGYTYQHEAGPRRCPVAWVEIPMSPKKTYEVLNAIRGLPLDRAETFLEEVIALKPRRPVPPLQPGDRPQEGDRSGTLSRRRSRRTSSSSSRTPSENAEYEGLDADRLFIKVAASARGRIRKATMPRAHGRGTAWNEQTTNVELVLAERKEKE